MSKNWAICIGINCYYSLKPLKYAVQDASAMQDFFENEVKFDQVFYFSDNSPEINTPKGPLRSEPTFANLKRFFRERFETPFLSVSDNLWFFFAGHGELHGGHDYLMPIDVDPGNIEETALKISDISAYLRNSGADNTVLLLDACRSRGRRASVGIGTDEQPGMVTIYSCSPRQSSYEIDEIGHGAFTYTLIEGFRLRGGNSCATVQRIDQYLRHQVPLLNKRYQKPAQTPYTEVTPLVKNCLILLPERARLEDVESLKNAAYRAEMESEWDFSLQLWMRVLAASRVDQDAIAAFQRIALRRVMQPSGDISSALSTADSRDVAVPTSGQSVLRQVEANKDVGIEPTDRIEFEVVQVDLQGNITQRQTQNAIHSKEDLGQDTMLDLVRIPSGLFQMGSLEGEGYDDERPQHEVSVSPFWMGRYVITQAQWSAVSALPRVERQLVANPSHLKVDEHPVTQVDLEDAVEFCRRLTQHSGREYRLPSGAEWEYACRAGTSTPFHFGETLTSEVANYDATYTYGCEPQGQYREKTTEVGSFPANGFGLYDMHGNVWEWCEDVWHESYTDAPNDGSAWLLGGNASKRLLRGGSWIFGPDGCRSAFCLWVAHDLKSFSVGFRVVCVA